MENERPAFKFYRSYWTVASELNDKDRLDFYDALMNRQFNGTIPNLKGMANFAFISQKHSIDAQIKGFEDKTGIKIQVIDNHTTQPPTQPPTQEIELEIELKEEIEIKIFSCFEFSELWSIYPNKSGKAVSENKYKKISEDDRMIIKKSINDFINNKPFKDYNHPMLSTYLNQKRWLDYIEPVTITQQYIPTQQQEGSFDFGFKPNRQ